MDKKLLILLICVFSGVNLSAQEFSNGRVSGNFSIEAQSYKEDSIIGAPKVDESILSNAFLNLKYTTNNFELGLRYENYLNPINGFDKRYKGQGIANRYANFHNEHINITVGDFYEQFGSGLILRAYEERALGFDNAIDGINLKIMPTEGLELTGLIGTQRFFWEKSSSIIRGANIELNTNSLFGCFISEDLNINLGGSVVSKFQSDVDPIYILPENVLAYSGRMGLMYDVLSFDAEYAYKYNDPNASNKYTYNPGQGLVLTGSYTMSGVGLLLSTHWLDNMDFRGDRNARANELNINFIPPLTKQHTYSLASIYPFATKPNGEFGLQGELTIKIPKEYDIFGDYGTSLVFNYSMIKSIDTLRKDEFTYDSKFFGIGDRLYFSDFNVDLTKRITEDFKMGITFISMVYDKDIMENEGAPLFGQVKSDVLVLDGTYNINDEHAIRVELQHVWSKQDSTFTDFDNSNGNWFTALMEYTIAPQWFFTVYNNYNYGNYFESLQVHYPTVSFAYLFNDIIGTARVQLSYGRQQGGVICVGGICRAVPASNGFYFTLTSSF